MMHRILMTRSNHPLQRTGAIKPIRQKDTFCLMPVITKKAAFAAFFMAYSISFSIRQFVNGIKKETSLIP
jgi:hypothetical protein